MIMDSLVWNELKKLLIPVGFLILIVYGPILYKKIKIKKVKVSKKDLVNNNQYVLNNKDVIEKSIDNNSDSLVGMKIKILLLSLLTIACIIICFVTKEVLISVSISIISFIILIVNIANFHSKNEELYVNVVRKTLNEIDSNLEYLPRSGFTKSEYYTCLFPETCDRFRSEDMIVNHEREFSYSDILVESEHENDDNTYYITEFKGSLARIRINNMNCRIFLGSTSGRLTFGTNKFSKITFENDEFNKLFRACSDNELEAYKLLTPDIMEEFVNIKKNTYGDIDIRIIYDQLYIRFLSGDTFDSAFSKETEKKNLLQSIAILEEVMKTMDKVKNIIEKKKID